MKSWWKGFAKKHPETSQGTSALSVSPRRSSSFFVDFSSSEIHADPAASQDEESQTIGRVCEASAAQTDSPASAKAEATVEQLGQELHQEDQSTNVLTWVIGSCCCIRCPVYRKLQSRSDLTVAEPKPQGIFGVPLRQSINYANVAISLVDEDGKSYIYGYVPIVVAKCGVFLKEKGT